jgi:subtilisin family serine protease
MSVITKIPFRFAAPLLIQSFRLVDEQDRIWSWFKTFLPEAIHFFGRVIIVGEEAIWQTDKPGVFRGLDNFTLAEKRAYAERFHRFRAHYLNSLDRLLPVGSTQREEWYSVLTALVQPDSMALYANGTDFIILWGFVFKNAKEFEIDPLIYQTIYDPPATDPVLEAVDTVVSESLSGMPDILHSTAGNSNSSSSLETQRWIRSNKHSPFGRFAWLTAFFWWLFEITWKYLITIALLIFLLWYLVCGCKGCKGIDYYVVNERRSEKLREAQKILDEIVLRPRPSIDMNKIDIRDSLYDRVLSNVVNLAPKNRNVNISELVVDVITFFPKPDYELVYADTATTRLQLRFADAKKGAIKAELKSKLGKYNLLVWDEAIFSAVRQFSDPGFQNPTVSWHLSAINCFRAWDVTLGDTSVCLAIIDDGFDLRHLDASRNIVRPYNTRSRNSNVWASEFNSHGTHTSGIATAKADNAIGLCGVAPGVALMPIQISDASGQFTQSDVIEGILYAVKNGADVINLSLGRQFDPRIQTLTEEQQKIFMSSQFNDEAIFWDEVFRYAEAENVVIVIAAGNNNILTGVDPFHRSRYSICVSAIDQNMRKASFSNYGSRSFISAPGVSIYSTIPNNNYAAMDGTSTASPIIAAAIALLKSQYPAITNEQVRSHLIATSFASSDLRVPPIINVAKILQKTPTL